MQFRECKKPEQISPAQLMIFSLHGRTAWISFLDRIWMPLPPTGEHRTERDVEHVAVYADRGEDRLADNVTPVGAPRPSQPEGTGLQPPLGASLTMFPVSMQAASSEEGERAPSAQTRALNRPGRPMRVEPRQFVPPVSRQP